MINYCFNILFLFCFIGTAQGQVVEVKSKPDEQIGACEQLIYRVTPSVVQHFKSEIIPADNGFDVFEVESVKGKIVLRGNNGVSLASAYNYYLKEYCRCLYSLWGNQMRLPDLLPEVPEKVRIVNSRKIRHFFNYCTYNYSGTWWNWKDWEKVIDFLAMNGINMPLSTVGVEAVWYHTLIELGLSDDQARTFLASPVYLSWQWMSNLEGTSGPLPKSWIDSHEKLGRQIMDREISLGMTPVVHGFSGHVPVVFKEVFPDARISIKPGWAKEAFKGAAQLDPLDPLFSKVGKVYLRNQIERLGSTHYYMTDPFHEGHPPVEGKKYLQDVGRAISRLLSEIDNKAIWMMQDWSLREDIVTAVDKDKLIIMNLAYSPQKIAKYANLGYRFTVGQLNNFGGRTFMHADLPDQAGNIPSKVIAENKNCVGSGMWMEGIGDNPVNYHLCLEMNWQNGKVDLSEWLKDWSERRYGGVSTKATQAWQSLMSNVYAIGGRGFGSIVAARPAIKSPKSGPNRGPGIDYDPKILVNAWNLLLSENKELKSSAAYRYDIVDFGRQVLSNLALFKQREMALAYIRKDKLLFEKTSMNFLVLLSDLDRLLGAEEAFVFGKMLKDAERWGVNTEESNYYRRSAAALPTIWGSDTAEPTLFDYGWREWSGLTGTFYSKRWEIFIKELKISLDKGVDYKDPENHVWGRPAFRADGVLSKIADFEMEYVANPPQAIKTTSTGDGVEIAIELFNKYKNELMAQPDKSPVEWGKMTKVEYDMGN